MSRLTFEGRVAIVTGAGGSTGLGRAHAQLLAERGARVLVNDVGTGRDGISGAAADAEAVAAEIVASGGEAIANLDSVADEAGANAVMQAALDAWGRVDILINNATVGARADFGEISSVDIERVIGVNLMGAIWMCRAVWPQMLAARYGRIINTTSGGMMGMPSVTAYGAAKFGMFGLTRGLATEGAEHHIKVNSVSPGAATNSVGRFLTFSDPAMLDNYRKQLPAELVSPVFAYLAHETCAVSGTLLHAAGGAVSARLIGATRGIAMPALTIEDVRDNIGGIFDDTGLASVIDPFCPYDAGSDQVAKTMISVPYRTDEMRERRPSQKKDQKV